MTQVFLEIGEPVREPKGPALLSAGHRPFFLCAALSAVFLLALWLFALMGDLTLSSTWHAHEMLYGFAGAAIAGFLMAAVPKWTNGRSPTGLPLAMITMIWVLGRIGVFAGDVYEELYMLAYADLLFMPIIAYVVARMIMGAKNARNYVVLAILGGIIISNIAYHFFDPANALRAGVFMVATLAALIGGRVIPAFTQNALRIHTGDQRIICSTPAWTHKATLVLMFLLAGTQLFGAPVMVTGAISAVLAAVLFFRMLKWRSLNTLFDPIVWILHAAYVWLPIGFTLKALSDLTGLVETNAALHALTSGGIGLLILAVASRAALGHSGRPLKVSVATVASYLLVIAATILRVLAFSPEWVTLSGMMWVAGFGLFAIVYTPILIKPRIDGLPG
ncbi:NnrS family protein [Terasakiella sp. A23]|uniref:NnrS family protein n=1 Tax=Terasakiella sp. FCG-A23 TaxID=3080561 RepID=UPI00295547FF|nr:NnrS family protein [Terasakiella sp. A23]MDV7340077.1 NnrS family protein [Terasakiella sp. A23]